MGDRSSGVDISVIVPVGTRHADATDLVREYRSGLDGLGKSYEMIFVLDGPRPDFESSLLSLLDSGANITVISLSRRFGEATALMTGFEQATGKTILTLPAYFQVQPDSLGTLLAALDSADVVVARRWPRAGGAFERIRRSTFHRLLGRVTKLNFSDLGCGARALRRYVLEEVQLYGDQHRFLAVLADRQGFRVREVDVGQSPKDHFEGVYEPRAYARGVLDIFTVFFLVRFTKKPLRFFGMVGIVTFLVGVLTVAVMVIQRLFFDQDLADRPALILASLFVVLGLQLFAVGLLGELLIFTHARALKDYQIERVIRFNQAPSPADAVPVAPTDVATT